MINSDEVIVAHIATKRDRVDYPIGMSSMFNKIFPDPKTKKLFLETSFERDLTKRKRLLYVLLNPNRIISLDTEEIPNHIIQKTLSQKNIECIENNIDYPGAYTNFIHALKESIFVIAPGNTPEVNLYEIWLCGAIPIIPFNQNIAEKFLGLPILWTTNYSEITGPYLFSKRDEYAANRKLQEPSYMRLRKSFYDAIKKERQNAAEEEKDFINMMMMK